MFWRTGLDNAGGPPLANICGWMALRFFLRPPCRVFVGVFFKCYVHCALVVLVQAEIFDTHFIVRLATSKTNMKREWLNFVRQVHKVLFRPFSRRALAFSSRTCLHLTNSRSFAMDILLPLCLRCLSLGNTTVCLDNTDVVLGNSCVCFNNTIVSLGNTNVCLGNTNAFLGNTNVCLGKTYVCLLDTSVCLSNTDDCLGKTYVCLLNTSVCLGKTYVCLLNTSSPWARATQRYQFEGPTESGTDLKLVLRWFQTFMISIWNR